MPVEKTLKRAEDDIALGRPDVAVQRLRGLVGSFLNGLRVLAGWLL